MTDLTAANFFRDRDVQDEHHLVRDRQPERVVADPRGVGGQREVRGAGGQKPAAREHEDQEPALRRREEAETAVHRVGPP